MRVAIHRQRDGRMTRQSLRGFGVYAGGGEIADKRVPKGMKVSHAIRVVTIHQEVRGFPLLPRLGIPERQPLPRTNPPE